MTGINPHQVRVQPEAGRLPAGAPDPLASGDSKCCCLSRPVWGRWLQQPELRQQGFTKSKRWIETLSTRVCWVTETLQERSCRGDGCGRGPQPQSTLCRAQIHLWPCAKFMSHHCFFKVVADCNSNSFKEKPYNREASGTNSSSRSCGWFQGRDQYPTPPCSPVHSGSPGPSRREAQTLVAEGLSSPCP